MIKGLVSIIIPCYNGEIFIDECFDAILKQTYKKIEVIAIDDGSNDKTLERLNSYIKKFNNNNMTLKVFHQDNKGQASAVNTGLKFVNGEYLTWQDCDDTFCIDAIENMVAFLNENNDFQLVRGEVNYVNKYLDKIYKVAKSKYPKETNIFNFYIYETDSYCFSGTFMIRMDYFDRCVKNRNIYESRAGQNWQLILPVSYNGKCGYINKAIYNYRQLENSHSHSNINKKTLLKKCDDHKDILYHIIDEINMDKNIRKKYRRNISKKYIYRKIDIIFKKEKVIIKRIIKKLKLIKD